MKRYSAFVHFINWLLAAAAGAILLYFGCTRWQGGAQEQPEVAAAIGGGAFILFIDLLWLVLRIITSRSITYLIFEKEGAGSLKVSVDAIEEAIDKAVMSMPEVVSTRTRLILDKGGRMPGQAIAHCVFNDVRNIFGVQESARQTIAARYQDIFPGEQLQIEIIVDRLLPEEAGHARKKKGKADDDSIFTGPRYPIEQ